MKFTNVDAEKTLICQMVLNPDIIPNVYDECKPEAFSSRTYSGMFSKLMEMQTAGIAIDLVSFVQECKGTYSPALCTELMDITSTSANWGYYATLVKKCYTSRMIEKLTDEIKGQLTDDNGDEVCAKIMQEVGVISANVSSCEIYDMSTLASNYIQKLDAAMSRMSSFTGYSTGLENLDKILHGIQNELVVLGARPSLGKTALGEQIALYMSGAMGFKDPTLKPVKTSFIELEMSADQLIERAVANLTKIPLSKTRSGLISHAQLTKIAVKVDELSKNENFVPVTCRSRKLSDIVGLIRRQVRNEGVKIVFIDHVGLIKPEGSYRSQWEGVAEISHTLQQLQREVNIPIVVLSQVARAVEGKAPSLADIRGSGAIEEDADTVMFIDRNRAKDEEESNIPTKVIIVKNRNGACGEVALRFMPSEVAFVDDYNAENDKERAEAPDMNKSSSSFASSRYNKSNYKSSKNDYEEKPVVQNDLFSSDVQEISVSHDDIEYEMEF